ncbi:hypothetical protein E2C01_019130 [Portunus trituberculatus]|uniref:Uncharacterized protein n=1 Tax=Portunus trituberculatus TaxID=210409 RepID=A0A5B7DWE7_PORTR|nr:hypothetical protein [Portunus trituberculatus]
MSPRGRSDPPPHVKPAVIAHQAVVAAVEAMSRLQPLSRGHLVQERRLASRRPAFYRPTCCCLSFTPSPFALPYLAISPLPPFITYLFSPYTLPLVLLRRPIIHRCLPSMPCLAPMHSV